MDPLAPRLPGYRVGHLLGQGGTAAVYFGRSETDDLAVAIKCWRVGQALRSEREQAALLALSHRNVIGIIGSADEEGGRRCLISHYVNGLSLEALLQASGPLRIERALEIAHEVATALLELTAHDLIHRDVKPGNIMIGRTPTQPGYENLPTRALLIDFGLVLGSTSAERTRTGEAVGTPLFAAPEQLGADGGDEVVSAAADIYGLGMTLLAMLVGTSPGDFASRERALERARELGLPADVVSLAEACVARSPAERPPAAELARRLRASRARHAIRRRRLHPLIAFGVGGAAALAVAQALRPGGEPLIAVRDPRAGVTPNILSDWPDTVRDLVQRPFIEDIEQEVECRQVPTLARVVFVARRQVVEDGRWRRSFSLQALAGLDCGQRHGDPETARSAFIFPKVLVPVTLVDGGSRWGVAITTSCTFTNVESHYEPAEDGQGYERRVQPDPTPAPVPPGLLARIGDKAWPLDQRAQEFESIVTDGAVDVVLELGHRPDDSERRFPLVGLGCLGWSFRPVPPEVRRAQHTPRWTRAALDFTISVRRGP